MSGAIEMCWLNAEIPDTQYLTCSHHFKRSLTNWLLGSQVYIISYIPLFYSTIVLMNPIHLKYHTYIPLSMISYIPYIVSYHISHFILMNIPLYSINILNQIHDDPRKSPDLSPVKSAKKRMPSGPNCIVSTSNDAGRGRPVRSCLGAVRNRFGLRQ